MTEAKQVNLTSGKATKKPVVVDFVQWTGDNLQQCLQFLGGDLDHVFSERHIGGKSELHIKTLEGIMIASKGDYIIRGAKGEHYPCKPDIFKLTYNIKSGD
jgi:hypothetical protein